MEMALAAVLGMLSYKIFPFVAQERGIVSGLLQAKAAVQQELKDNLPSTIEAPLMERAQSEIARALTARFPGSHGGHGEGQRLTVQIPGEFEAAAPVAGREEVREARVQVTPGTPVAVTPIQPVSPLVHRGLILNVETGKTIQIGKGTYNSLLESGYVVDTAQGTITPPLTAGGNGGTSRRQSHGDRGHGGGEGGSGGSGEGRGRRRGRSRSRSRRR